MANMWTDRRNVANENSQYAPMKSKQMLSNGSSSVKKLALGEIKNVIHNHISATPLKGNAAKIDGLPSAFNPPRSLCNDVLRKQVKRNFADAEKELQRKHKSSMVTNTYEGPVFDEEVFDCWDREHVCYDKREEEAWSDIEFEPFSFKEIFFPSDDEEDKQKLFEDSYALQDLRDFPESSDLPDANEVFPEEFQFSDIAHVDPFASWKSERIQNDLDFEDEMKL